MDIKLITPFSQAVAGVLEQFGINASAATEFQRKEELLIQSEFTAFVGLVGNLRGNIAYCYSLETAKQLASIMMMGMPVDEVNDMVRSALAELANMFTGNSTALFEAENLTVDITPPSVVAGTDIYFILSFHEAYTVTVQTPAGEIEINVSLEI